MQPTRPWTGQRSTPEPTDSGWSRQTGSSQSPVPQRMGHRAFRILLPAGLPSPPVCESGLVPFSRAELLTFQDALVPDLTGPGLRLLFVGINPGLWSAATASHFARPGNRFYPALAAAGITEHLIRAGDGMTQHGRGHLISRGVGITNMVARATARADELTKDELRAGACRLIEKVEALEPRVVAVAGISAYRVGFDQPKAQLGRQPNPLGGAELWAVPNPSGLNAHHNVQSLAAAYREAAQAAGLDLAQPAQQ